MSSTPSKSRKSQLIIHESVTRWVTWCWVTRGTFENLTSYKEWLGNEIWSIYNYKHFEIWTFLQVNRYNLLTSCVSVAVLSLLYRHCYSCQKTKSRLHIPISTVVHAKVVCAPKILPIGIFHSYSLQSEIISPRDMSQYQTPRAFRRKRAFSTCISKFVPLWLCSWQSDWTRPRKRLGYEVNFLSTAIGTVD